MRREILLGEPIRGSHSETVYDRYRIGVKTPEGEIFYTCRAYYIICRGQEELLLISSEEDKNDIIKVYKTWDDVAEYEV